MRALHAADKHVVCYIDVGTWERWRPDAAAFPKRVIGADNGWPGERWLDVRQLSVLEPIMAKRLAMCAAKGFDAVEPDNIDGYENHPGFPITGAQELRYLRWIAAQAHRLHMAVLQKNDPDQVSSLQPLFDGALVEQCNQYQECGAFSAYVKAAKPVFDAEYSRTLYPGFCANDAKLGVMGVLYDLDLDGRVYEPCTS